jgi:hypothetical protein
VHPFRVGVTISQSASGEARVAGARRAEELGYAIFYCTLGQLRDRLLRRRDRLGISNSTILGHAMEAMAPLGAAVAGR